MPITQSNHEAAQSQSTTNDRRRNIQMEDLAVGCVVWLPTKGGSHDSGGEIRCIKEACCGNQELHDDAYNHPVVILQVSAGSARRTICAIALVTSKTRHNGSDRIAISQAGPAPQGGGHGHHDGATLELYLEKGPMIKQSYVRLSHIFQVEAGQLRSCSFRHGTRAYDLRLCEESYHLLVSKLGSEPQPWAATALLERRVRGPSERPHRHHAQPLPQPPRPPVPTHPVPPSPHRNTGGRPVPVLNAASRTREVENRPLLDDYSPPERPRPRPDSGGGGDGVYFFVGLIAILTVGAFAWRSWK